jgi:tRNA G26 N,N-dimethylase Trm1
MKKPYFNKKARKSAKANGIRGISIVVENRNTSATTNDNSPKNNKL